MPEAPTALEEARSETGRRHYLCLPTKYPEIHASLNVALGYPKGAGTRAHTSDAIPPPSRARTHAGPPVMVKLSVEEWRVPPEIDTWLAPYIADGSVIEVTKDWVELEPSPD